MIYFYPWFTFRWDPLIRKDLGKHHPAISPVLAAINGRSDTAMKPAVC
jgi:hypothetical protein